MFNDQSFFSWWSFPLIPRHYCSIQGWYCKSLLGAQRTKQLTKYSLRLHILNTLRRADQYYPNIGPQSPSKQSCALLLVIIKLLKGKDQGRSCIEEWFTAWQTSTTFEHILNSGHFCLKFQVPYSLIPLFVENKPFQKITCAQKSLQPFPECWYTESWVGFLWETHSFPDSP